LFKKVRDWKKELKEEITDLFKGDWTWKKVSDILQSLHVAGFKQIGNLPSQDFDLSVPEVVVGLDASRSISDQEYKKFLNENYSIFRSVKIQRFYIIIFDAEVQKVFEGREGLIQKALNFLKVRKGYGGTCLRSFLDYCNKKIKHTNKIAIILTDAYFENDLELNEFKGFKKVFFVLTKDCNYENVKKLKSNKVKILKLRE